MKKNISALLLTGMLFSAGALGGTAYAAEESTEVTATIEGGALTISDHSNSMDFGTITFDGEAHLVTSNGTITIDDLTGMYAGWNVQVKRDAVSTWNEGMIIRLAGADVQLVEINTDNQLFISQAAVAGYDMSQDFQFDSSLYIPGSVSPGSYSTAITWTLSQGPA